MRSRSHFVDHLGGFCYNLEIIQLLRVTQLGPYKVNLRYDCLLTSGNVPS